MSTAAEVLREVVILTACLESVNRISRLVGTECRMLRPRSQWYKARV